jgi:predicted RND superfamily exporter protein
MLEDGELSDDDLDEEIRPPPPPLETTNPTTGSNKSKNKISLLPTPKLALLGEQPLSSSSQIPSLLSPSFDSLIDKINSSLNQNNNSSNNKRKSKHVQNGDNKSSNKKKLKDKHHHHHHRHRHVYDDNDQDEDGQEEVQAQDQDDRLFDASATYFTPINSKNTNATAKAPLLATPVWSPAPSGSAPAKQAPVSLLDLFKNTNHPLNENHNSHQMQQHQQQQQQSHFVNPIIIEKENSKPKLVHDHEDEEEADSTEMVSVDSIKEKLDKKRKYADIHKITKQKEAEKQQLQKEKSAQLKEKVLCHFFVEGRCQKGDKCTFSHNLQLNPKKYEICKFYLNGFCAKGDKCFFMHA